MRILIVEDQKRLAAAIKRGLTEEGYAVDIANDGEEGELLAASIPYDLIILDIILPKKDGISVCLGLRQKNIRTRILMLTCKDSVSDRVEGLDSGADDYMVKPFAHDELLARIRALLRRDISRGSTIIRVGDLSLDTGTKRVSLGEKPIELTSKEYSILEYLMSNPDMVITRRKIEEHVWDISLDSASNLVDVYIRRLRYKLEEGGRPGIIETVRGAGYRLKAP